MADMHATIRHATPGDAAAIARIHVVAWQVAYRGLIPDSYLDALSVTKRAEGWTRYLQPSERRHFVLEDGDGMIGWATIGPCRDAGASAGTGELYAMYLDPARWRQGWGGRLFAHCEQELHAAGFARYTLWVMAANQRARAFYERMGLAPDGTTKRDSCEGAVVDEVRYVKALV